ncbi:protein kinase activator Bem1, partial [Striga asiatica]
VPNLIHLKFPISFQNAAPSLKSSPPRNFPQILPAVPISSEFRPYTATPLGPSRYSSVAHQSSVDRCSSVGRCSSVQSRSSSSPVVDSHGRTSRPSLAAPPTSVALLRPRCTSVVAAPPSSLILHSRCHLGSSRQAKKWTQAGRAAIVHPPDLTYRLLRTQRMEKYEPIEQILFKIRSCLKKL